MIGAFARMTARRDRLLRIDEAPEGTTIHTGQGATTVQDGPPPAFVQSVADEGGTVHVSPLVEALRDWLAKGRHAPRNAPDASTTATENTTPAPATEGA